MSRALSASIHRQDTVLSVGEPVVQVSVGGEQQHCQGCVRGMYHLVDVEWVQPGEGGNRQDEPASPDIDPGHAAQFARLRQV